MSATETSDRVEATGLVMFGAVKEMVRRHRLPRREGQGNPDSRVFRFSIRVMRGVICWLTRSGSFSFQDFSDSLQFLKNLATRISSRKRFGFSLHSYGSHSLDLCQDELFDLLEVLDAEHNCFSYPGRNFSACASNSVHRRLLIHSQESSICCTFFLSTSIT
jgi:hypothetical protein